jgi:outer membrane biosynthesis protein TonB
LQVCSAQLARLQERIPSEEANMKRYFTWWIFLPFWASPNNSIYDLILKSTDFSASRRARSLDPGFPFEDPLQQPPVRPVRPIPTDVPVPEPRDVPVREPMDVPPPEPEKPIKPMKPNPPPRTNPKPRPTP